MGWLFQTDEEKQKDAEILKNINSLLGVDKIRQQAHDARVDRVTKKLSNKDYVILSALMSEDLEKDVEIALSVGFEPVGNPYGVMLMFQAMRKTKQNS